jgi:hypothetical protein
MASESFDTRVIMDGQSHVKIQASRPTPQVCSGMRKKIATYIKAAERYVMLLIVSRGFASIGGD